IDDPVFPDPVRALANFGVLSPVLARALLLEGEPFADAGAFRDALVAIVESGGRRPLEVRAERGLSAVGTVSPLLRQGARPNTVLEGDGTLGSLEKFAGEAKGPALVLPPDLAAKAPVPPSGAFVVMDEASTITRVRSAAEETRERFAHIPWGRVAAAAAVLVLLVTAAVVARRLTSGGASAATLAEPDAPPATIAAITPATVDNPPVTTPVLPDSTVRDSSGAPADSAPVIRTALFQVSPRSEERRVGQRG